MFSAYTTRANLILGFHGCDRSTLEKVAAGKDPLIHSENTYDWLGNGIYFWENSPARALQFAEERKAKPHLGKTKIEHPSVIGAVINLGFCLDLIDSGNILLIRNAYRTLKETVAKGGIEMPRNTGRSGEDLLRRELDCAVIETIYSRRAEKQELMFDSARAMYIEGKEVYPDAGFREKNHIQICIRNPNCIKGYFIPRQYDRKYPRV